MPQPGASLPKRSQGEMHTFPSWKSNKHSVSLEGIAIALFDWQLLVPWGTVKGGKFTPGNYKQQVPALDQYYSAPILNWSACTEIVWNKMTVRAAWDTDKRQKIKNKLKAVSLHWEEFSCGFSGIVFWKTLGFCYPFNFWSSHKTSKPGLYL